VGIHNLEVDGAYLLDLPVISDTRGDLTFIENQKHIPFDIARVYYLYNLPVDANRGGHAHRDLQQVIFALSGSFRILLDDGQRKTEVILRNPSIGLYINRMVWREMDFFSQSAVCMVIASNPYDESDYYRNYEGFIEAVQSNKI
jgi:dTDP-4-dehydrorhamnose 3,5-epimerase-like enzyme